MSLVRSCQYASACQNYLNILSSLKVIDIFTNGRAGMVIIEHSSLALLSDNFTVGRAIRIFRAVLVCCRARTIKSKARKAT